MLTNGCFFESHAVHYREPSLVFYPAFFYPVRHHGTHLLHLSKIFKSPLSYEVCMYQAPRGILRTTMTEVNEPTSSVPQFLDRDWSLVQYYSSILAVKAQHKTCTT